jgi:hypothetical protein
MELAMRSPFQPSPDARKPERRLGDEAGALYVAEARLGAWHPLVGLLYARDTALEQAGSVVAAQAAGVVFFLGDQPFGLALVVAGLVVELGLGVRLAILAASRRNICLDLIVEGRSELPLACVQRHGQHLLRPRHLARLRDTIEELVDVAVRPPAGLAVVGPLSRVTLLRRVAPELREVALLLRTDDPALRGVALVERLVTCGDSPLYGAEPGPLRDELLRARLLLTC